MVKNFEMGHCEYVNCVVTGYMEVAAKVIEGHLTLPGNYKITTTLRWKVQNQRD